MTGGPVAVLEGSEATDSLAQPDPSSSGDGLELVPLHTGAQLEAAAKLLWSVWGAKTGAERNGVISTVLLRTLCQSGNYVVGAYRLGRMIGCTVGMLGSRSGKTDHLYSYITGVEESERRHGAGFALKRHQRQWALDLGIETISWTFDPLVSRNGHFNLCRLGAMVVSYKEHFYGRLEDGVDNNEQTDRLMVDWSLRDEWVTRAMGYETATIRRHACVEPGAELIDIPPDIVTLRQTDHERAQQERHAMRKSFQTLLGQGYRVAGMRPAAPEGTTSDGRFQYVLLPADTTPRYEEA
jgi:predicted GNAT superfamily acetyltransferase